MPSRHAAGVLACQPEINTAACNFINILTGETRGRFTADMALSEGLSAAGAPTHPAEDPRCGSEEDAWVVCGEAAPLLALPGACSAPNANH